MPAKGQHGEANRPSRRDKRQLTPMKTRIMISTGMLIAALVFAASPVAAAASASNTCTYAVVAGAGAPCVVGGSMTCNNPGFNCLFTTTCSVTGVGLLSCTETADYRVPHGTTVSGALGVCTPTGVGVSVTVRCTVNMVP